MLACWSTEIGQHVFRYFLRVFPYTYNIAGINVLLTIWRTLIVKIFLVCEFFGSLAILNSLDVSKRTRDIAEYVCSSGASSHYFVISDRCFHALSLLKSALVYVMFSIWTWSNASECQHTTGWYIGWTAETCLAVVLIRGEGNATAYAWSNETVFMHVGILVRIMR